MITIAKKVISVIEFLLIVITISNCSISNYPIVEKKKEDKLAAKLNKLLYYDLFPSEDNSLFDSIWLNGKNQEALLFIVSQERYNEFVRVLASEILYEKKADYPTPNLKDVLSHIYPKALEIAGNNESRFSGNLWGFMYHTDKFGINDFGILGKHLIEIGKVCIPYLAKRLNNNNLLIYEGSRDATTGNMLKYRVKDAAAYYIGKLANIPVQFYENHADRDAEIERLKEKLKNQ